jgi:hypothetical protein
MENPAPAVRAKFRVVSKEERLASPIRDLEGELHDEVQVEVKLTVVYASGPTIEAERGILLGSNAVEENRIFGTATPAGSIAMLIKNRAAADALVIGQAYYVDFTPADG